jgi:hypothetical protein
MLCYQINSCSRSIYAGFGTVWHKFWAGQYKPPVVQLARYSLVFGVKLTNWLTSLVLCRFLVQCYPPVLRVHEPF